MANELQLAAGLKLTNPAPADAYYCKPQVGQAPAQPYATVAEACSFVVQPLRYQGMTVNVAGDEYWWLTADLSDFGLVVKSSSVTVPTPSPGGGVAKKAFSRDVTQAGANTFDLPDGYDDVYPSLKVQQASAYPERPVRPLLDIHYRVESAKLIVSADAKLGVGDTVVGTATSGGGGAGTGGGTSRDFNNVPQSVQDAVTDPSHTWLYGDLTSYGTDDLRTAALDGVVKLDYFDAYEQGSTTDAYRYCYCGQNDGTLGWTRLNKLT